MNTLGDHTSTLKTRIQRSLHTDFYSHYGDTQDTGFYAASFNDILYMEYLWSQNVLEDGGVCTQAAMFGHFDCLRYAHEHGWSWDENTCRDAAEKGHIDCLRYAIENGCPCPMDVLGGLVSVNRGIFR